MHGSTIVVKQGRPGGVLWFNPKVVDHTGVTTSEVLPLALAHIQAGVQEPSLTAAKRYVANAHQASSSSSTSGNDAGAARPTVPVIGPSGYASPTTTVPPAGDAGHRPRRAPGATTTTTPSR